MARNSKITPDSSQSMTGKRSRGESCSWSQLVAIVEWLEKKENFNLVTGQATSGMKGTVAGSKLKKKDGYAM